MTHYDGNGNRLSSEAHTVTPVSGAPLDATADNTWLEGRETETKFYAADGQTVLRDVVYSYQQRSCAGDSTCWFTQSNNNALPNYSSSENGKKAPPHDPQLISETVAEGGAMLGSAFAIWSQSKPKRLTEEDEWKDAYGLAKRLGSDHPKAGFVPNEEAATGLAEVIAIGLYGEDTVKHARPYRARLQGNVWIVMGTQPPLALGGAAIIQTSKEDARVLFAHHTQ